MIQEIIRKYGWITRESKYPAAIVIPIYKGTLSNYESISLDRCFRVFTQHPIIIFKPFGLDTSFLGIESNKFQVVEFPPEFFESVSSYSRLLLSRFFYERFLDYKHILIYQLDAFAFRDDLLKWCQMDYAYIGAPWFGQTWNLKPDETWIIDRVLNKTNFTRKFIKPRMVGNGGFSLRKVKFCMVALALLNKSASNFPYNEDVFWSLNVPKRLPFFKIPSAKLALQFSVEFEPRQAIELNDNKLPFGCHAWEKWDIDFWRPIFESYGYHI